jgi:IS30 family transposase
MEVSRELRKMLTYDRGKEMVQHKKVREDTGIAVYFADLHSPWQKGSCENTNGLISFFPKVSYEEIKHVQDMLNDRIRKTLNWKSLKEVFYRLTGAIKT